MNTTMKWTEQASCLGKNDLFIRTAYSAAEEPKSPDDIEAVAEAKRTCISCPVRRQCLDDAMQEEKYLGAADRHGIRGGLTARERIFLAIKDNPFCASCGVNKPPSWDRIYMIRTICRKCLAGMHSDPALKYQLKEAPREFTNV